MCFGGVALEGSESRDRDFFGCILSKSSVLLLVSPESPTLTSSSEQSTRSNFALHLADGKIQDGRPKTNLQFITAVLYFVRGMSRHVDVLVNQSLMP